MSLQYVYLGKSNLKKLLKTKKARQFYDGLIWATISTGIGYLCEESAREFCRRCNEMHLFTVMLLPEHIEPYYGLRTNVNTETAREWALRRYAGQHTQDAYTKKWADKIDRLAYSPENEEKYNKLVKEQEKRDGKRKT